MAYLPPKFYIPNIAVDSTSAHEVDESCWFGCMSVERIERINIAAATRYGQIAVFGGQPADSVEVFTTLQCAGNCDNALGMTACKLESFSSVMPVDTPSVNEA